MLTDAPWQSTWPLCVYFVCDYPNFLLLKDSRFELWPKHRGCWILYACAFIVLFSERKCQQLGHRDVVDLFETLFFGWQARQERRCSLPPQLISLEPNSRLSKGGKILDQKAKTWSWETSWAPLGLMPETWHFPPCSSLLSMWKRKMARFTYTFLFFYLFCVT